MQSPGLLAILFGLIDTILALVIVVLIVFVVISWLYAFDIVSRRNGFVSSIYEFCRRVTDPILRPLRRIIPPIAGVDLSVLVLLLVIQLLRQLLPWLHGVLTGTGPVL
ncbi:YggT family protein [Terricaulis sp.]|jgi:YggT family protein|uniref:YggT family protein n=1 Tax=Terricaulis sp. TaxID=2768686 RepID=UPI002AC72C52|nr:YggT family protein [Terricaulis sp.]MDZ4691289.1 YggT family protein [Terricaulis sp.]